VKVDDTIEAVVEKAWRAEDGRKKARCPHCLTYIHIFRMEKHIRIAHPSSADTHK
jgi:hypothetical protein